MKCVVLVRRRKRPAEQFNSQAAERASQCADYRRPGECHLHEDIADEHADHHRSRQADCVVAFLRFVAHAVILAAARNSVDAEEGKGDRQEGADHNRGTRDNNLVASGFHAVHLAADHAMPDHFREPASAGGASPSCRTPVIAGPPLRHSLPAFTAQSAASPDTSPSNPVPNHSDESRASAVSIAGGKRASWNMLWCLLGGSGSAAPAAPAIASTDKHITNATRNQIRFARSFIRISSGVSRYSAIHAGVTCNNRAGQ